MIYRTPYARLLVLIGTTPHATVLIQAAHGLSQRGAHIDSQILIAQAADAIANAHPEDVPDPILLRDVLAAHFLD